MDDVCTVVVQNISKETVLGIDGKSVVLGMSQYVNATNQNWKKGVPDGQGYFTLTNASTQQVLTAVSEQDFGTRGKLKVYKYTEGLVNHFPFKTPVRCKK